MRETLPPLNPSAPKRLGLLAAALLLAGAFAAPLRAQTAAERTFEVRGGVLYLDGARMAAAQLPDDLAPETLAEARITFSGDVQPVFMLGERLFALDGANLRELETQGVVVHFEGVSGFSFGEPVMRAFPFEGAAPQSARLAASFGVAPAAEAPAFEAAPRLEVAPSVAGPQVDMIALHAQQFLRRSSELERAGAPESAARLRNSAQDMLRMAEDLPRMEYTAYLDDVRRHNGELYNRLLRENQLEERSLALASDIRGASDAARRTLLEQQLRGILNDAFDLKQENRRREVRHLESQLDALRLRLRERETNRKQIIEQRALELIGSPAGARW